MTIELSPQLEEIINEKVSSGMYADAADFIQQAILFVTRYEQLKREKLNEAVAIGIDQADRGELMELDLDQINAELDAELGYVDA